MWGPSSRGPRAYGRLGWALLGTLPFAFAGPSAAAGLATSCHIHPPAELVERGEQPSTIGPYPSGPACESERLALFGDRGRCHCTQGFAPGPSAGPSRGPDRSGRPGSAGGIEPSWPRLP
jgi:hypothetical protein